MPLLIVFVIVVILAVTSCDTSQTPKLETNTRPAAVTSACREAVVQAVRAAGYKANATSDSLFNQMSSPYEESGFTQTADGEYQYSMGVEADYGSSGTKTWYHCIVEKNGKATVSQQ